MKDYRYTICRSHPTRRDEDEILEYCDFRRSRGYARDDFRNALNSLLYLAEEFKERYLIYTLSEVGRLPSLRLECIRRRCPGNETTYDFFLNFKYLRSVTLP